jgi:DNA polymerase
VKLITIDTETYYSKDLGFKTHTTEAYIRHDDFHVIGVSVAVGDEPAQWFSGTHEQIKVWFNQFDWENSAVLAHNTAFDGAILSWKFGINPPVWLDTLSMARALHGVDAGGSLKALAERYQIGVKGTEVENALGLRRVDFSPEQLARYGEYCCNDTELTRDLFRILAQDFPMKELRVIDATLRMFIQPRLILDAATLTQHLHEVREKKAQLLAAAEADSDVLMSNDKFAELLTRLGVEPPRKISARTGKEAWAFAKTDEAFKALLEHHDPRVQVLVSARLGTKTTLEETRTQRLLDIAGRGPLPIPLRYYGARTGRWAGCLVADTQVLVYDPEQGVVSKRITDVLADDLVWDGLEFVAHEGVQFSGYQETIYWDGIEGTADHVVFTDVGEISLQDAMQGKHRIQTPGSPSAHAVEAARKLAGNYKE